jgi:hypothetical protein
MNLSHSPTVAKARDRQLSIGIRNDPFFEAGLTWRDVADAARLRCTMLATVSLLDSSL